MTERQKRVVAALRAGVTNALKGVPAEQVDAFHVGNKAIDILEVIEALDESQAENEKLKAQLAAVNVPAPQHVGE